MGETCTCGGRPSPIYPTQLCICEAFAVRRGMNAIAAGVVGAVFHGDTMRGLSAPRICETGAVRQTAFSRDFRRGAVEGAET